MQTISDLELPFIPFEDKAFQADPFPYFTEARTQHPWLAKCSFAYVITQYSAVRDLMAYDDVMCVGYGSAVDLLGAAGTPWGEFIKHAIQNQTGALHKRLRDAVAPAFTPRAANQHRHIMQEQMAALLDEWGPKEAFDFEYFASHFPVSVMCRIVGASPQVVPELRSSLEILGLGGSFEVSYVPKFQQAFQVMDTFVRELVAERRTGNRISAEPDLLDRLLSIHDEGGLDEAELFNLLVFVFVGGYDTSKNLLSLILYLLLDRQDIYERCAEDLEYSRKVVSETLRYQGIASSPRVLLEDISLRDIFIPKDTMLFVPWSVLNRDPESFHHADIFNPERPRDAGPIPFGLGPHMCLGQFIARAQIEEGLHLLTQRIKHPRLTGNVGWREFVGAWGLRGFPIAFDYCPN